MKREALSFLDLKGIGKKSTRKGLSLISLLVSLFVGILVTLTLAALLKSNTEIINKTERQQIINEKLSDLANLIEVDLEKAGYNVNSTLYKPVEFLNNTLIIRYVDYEIASCNNATYKEPPQSHSEKDKDRCSKKVEYIYSSSNGKLDRKVNKSSPIQLFKWPENIKVTKFNVAIDSNTKLVKVNIQLTDNKSGKKYYREVSNVCRNWK